MHIYIYPTCFPQHTWPPIQPAVFVASGVARSRVARDRGGQLQRGEGVVVKICL